MPYILGDGVKKFQKLNKTSLKNLGIGKLNNLNFFNKL